MSNFFTVSVVFIEEIQQAMIENGCWVKGVRSMKFIDNNSLVVIDCGDNLQAASIMAKYWLY